MPKILRKLLIGGLLVFAASSAYSMPVKYGFTTTGQFGFSDPLLTGLGSVSGTFYYDNSVPSLGVSGGGRAPGSDIYIPMSDLAGVADGNSFSDPLGAVLVGDEKFDGFLDFFLITWDSGGAGLNGFSYNGLDLVNVRFFWIEGQDGLGDFLTDQSLPASLPPANAGRLAMDFVDAAGQLHYAFYTFDMVRVPEPGTLALFGLGLLGLGFAKRRRT